MPGPTWIILIPSNWAVWGNSQRLRLGSFWTGLENKRSSSSHILLYHLKIKYLPSHKTPDRSGLPFLQVPEVFWFIVSFGPSKSNSQHSHLLLQATHLVVSGQSVFERLWYRGTTNQDKVWQMSGSEFLSGKQIKEMACNCIQCHIIYRWYFQAKLIYHIMLHHMLFSSIHPDDLSYAPVKSL